jgi:hypothetical protein
MQSMTAPAIAIAALIIGAIVVLELAGGDHNTAIGHIIAIGLLLINIARSSQNGQRLGDLHDAINGQTIERIDAAHAAGVAQGRGERDSE